ncbi:MAG: outer membrane protein assembly factor BamB [Thiobacillaceae bacterium]
MNARAAVSTGGRLLAGILLVALVGCSTVGGWFGGSSKPAVKPNELTDFKASVTLTPVWKQETSVVGRGVLIPAMDGEGVVAAGGKGDVHRFNVQSGQEEWKTVLGGDLAAGPGTGGGLVLLGDFRGELYALDGATGKKRWESQLSSDVAGIPVVAGDTVVVRTGDGKIFGLSSADGTQRWLFTIQLPLLSLQINKGVVQKDGIVYAGFAGGTLLAIDEKNGAQRWEASVTIPHGATELERVSDVAGSPVLDNRRVCAVAYQGRVACFDLSNGSPNWNRETSSDSGLAMDDENVYVTDEKGIITAYDKDSGRAVWRQDKLANRRVTGPLALGKVIAVGDFEGYVHLLSTEDGSFVGRAKAEGGAIQYAPVDIGPGIAVETAKGTVTAFKLN